MFDGFWHEKLQKKSPRFSWRGDFWGNGCDNRFLLGLCQIGTAPNSNLRIVK